LLSNPLSPKRLVPVHAPPDAGKKGFLLLLKTEKRIQSWRRQGGMQKKRRSRAQIPYNLEELEEKPPLAL
jgi:hypothetical protein